VNVYLPKDRVTNNHQGYGFVEYRAEEDADYVRSRVGVRGWAEGCIAGGGGVSGVRLCGVQGRGRRRPCDRHGARSCGMFGSLACAWAIKGQLHGVQGRAERRLRELRGVPSYVTSILQGNAFLGYGQGLAEDDVDADWCSGWKL
jgi:hypothetical protein